MALELRKYNGCGNLTVVTDALGNKTCYEYDDMSRIVKEVNAVGSEKSYEYDCNGNITKYIDFDGTVTTYKYDETGRLKERDVNGEKTVYRYDINGSDTDRLVSVVNNDGIVSYTYDDYGRIASKTDTNNITVGYEYTLSGKVSKILTPYGDTTCQYDLMERLVRVVDHSGNITVYSYDNLGNRTTVTYANGVKMQYKYDSCSHLIQEDIIDKNSNIIKTYIYKRDKNGNPVSIDEITDEVTITTEYKYDKTGKLVTEILHDNNGSLKFEYTYDAVGNRLSKNTIVTGDISGIAGADNNISNSKAEYVYNDNNQLIKEKCGDKEVVYTYDLNGNLVTVSNGSNDIRYEYNAQNKITKYYGNGIAYSYKYDYEGNRIGKYTDNESINYVVDSIEELSYVLAETDISGKIVKYYTRGSELISQETEGGLSNYQYDGHGNVCILTDGSGDISNLYRYDAFGNILFKSGQTENSYLYNGEEFNEESGLYYLRARHMNPVTGTFIQRDTYQGDVYDAVSLHRYLYAGANPVIYNDPSGNFFSLIELNVSSAISNITDSINNVASLIRGKSLIDKATLLVSGIGISTAMLDLVSGEGDISSVFDDIVSITLSAFTIATVIMDNPKYIAFSMGVGAIAFGYDLGGVINAICNRDWWQLVSKLGCLAIDAISLRAGYDGYKLEELRLKYLSGVHRNGDQMALIDITKEAIAQGGITKEVEGVLYEWAKQYNSLEDVWNLINHLL
ncbi:MAG: hypothetical protein HDT39_10725 [Lachnospiraceae bacterium]|nr:hypothetical protein [Lachnospiraceae bacterium]